MQGNPLQAIVADAHPIVRAWIIRELEAAGIVVVGEAAYGEETLQLVEAYRPDLLILDAEMPGMGAGDVCRYGQLADPGLRILVLSVYDHAAYVGQLLEAGATGYILREEARDMVVQAVLATAAGVLWLSPKVTTSITQLLQSDGDINALVLTPRDIVLLRHIAAGKTNAEIATALHIQTQTVRNYMSCLYKKLGVRSRMEAALWATRYGEGS